MAPATTTAILASTAPDTIAPVTTKPMNTIRDKAMELQTMLEEYILSPADSSPSLAAEYGTLLRASREVFVAEHMAEFKRKQQITMKTGPLITLRSILKDQNSKDFLLNEAKPSLLISIILSEIWRRKGAIVVRYPLNAIKNWARDVRIMTAELKQVEANMEKGDRGKQLHILEVILRQFAALYWMCFVDMFLVQKGVEGKETEKKGMAEKEKVEYEKVADNATLAHKEEDLNSDGWMKVGLPYMTRAKADQANNVSKNDKENVGKAKEDGGVIGNKVVMITSRETQIESSEADGWYFV